MTLGRFLILVAVTVAAVVWAAVAITQRDRAVIVVGSGERLFPALTGSLQDLETVVVQGPGDATVTVRRRGEDWTVDERGGYPADPAKVRRLVVAAAELEKVEAKTDRPEQYARIGVDGVENADGSDAVEASGGASRLVTFIDNEGEVVVRLIVGDAAAGLGGEPGRYVRAPHVKQAWLVRGDIDPATEPSDWLAASIIDVPAALVEKIVIRHPDGEMITARRDDPQDGAFVVAEMPASSRLRRPEDVGGLAGLLEGLTLDDVRPIDEITFPPVGTIHATFSTYDGMVVTIDLTEVDGEPWARLLAGTTPTKDADDANALDAVQSLNARTSGWAYRLPERTAAVLRNRLDALMVDEPSGS